MKTKTEKLKSNSSKVTQYFKVENKDTVYTIEFERKAKK